MDELLAFRISWSRFFILALALLAFSVVLRLISRFIRNSTFNRNLKEIMNPLINRMLILYEPLAIILLGGSFIFIRPVFHGVLVSFFLIVGFPYVRNYLSGKLVQLDEAISEGKAIRVNDIQGVISREGNMGLRIQNSEGIHHITYTRLLSDGYALITEKEEIGKYSQLLLSPKEQKPKKDYVLELNDLLTTTPFIHWGYRPEVTANPNDPAKFEIKVFIRDRYHLQGLRRLIEEWGYTCQIVQNF